MTWRAECQYQNPDAAERWASAESDSPHLARLWGDRHRSNTGHVVEVVEV